MDDKKSETKITGGEWNVMECLWEKCPRTAMELVRELQKSVGWAKSTTMTMLSRIEAKGLVNVDSNGRGKLYSPAIGREDTAAVETRSFLNRVYRGSIGMMMNAMIDRSELSQEDIDELYSILEAGKESRRD